MLQLSAALLNRPVLSLRTGSPVGMSEAAIINPNNLKIEGFYCADKFSKHRLILLSQDIRDIISDGLIVNDHDALTHPDELVRLKGILDLDFELIGKRVETESKRKVGRVVDFAADDQALYIQKLYVSQPILKSVGSTHLNIDRSQIVEITDKRIIIKNLENRAKSTVAVPAAA